MFLVSVDVGMWKASDLNAVPIASGHTVRYTIQAPGICGMPLCPVSVAIGGAGIFCHGEYASRMTPTLVPKLERLVKADYHQNDPSQLITPLVNVG